MTRPDRRRLLAGGAVSLLAACTGPFDPLAPEDGVADGKRPPVEGGIGGTGIVGVITALGSIRVNGLRVGLEGAEVADAFGPQERGALRPGVSVTAEAAEGPEGLVARRVALTHPLVGPVEALSGDGRRITVLGTGVALEPGVNAPLEVGDRVAVSGLWRGAEVVASRIDRLGPGPSAMAGALAPGGRLGGLGVSAPGLPAAGAFVTLVGRRDGPRFRADTVREGRFFGAAGPLMRLSVEGYLQPVERAPGFVVSGLGHSFDPAARLAPLAGTRSVFVGAYTGDFAVTAALPVPEGPLLRRRRLAGLAPITDRAEAVATR